MQITFLGGADEVGASCLLLDSRWLKNNSPATAILIAGQPVNGLTVTNVPNITIDTGGRVLAVAQTTEPTNVAVTQLEAIEQGLHSGILFHVQIRVRLSVAGEELAQLARPRVAAVADQPGAAFGFDDDRPPADQGGPYLLEGAGFQVNLKTPRPAPQ